MKQFMKTGIIVLIWLLLPVVLFQNTVSGQTPDIKIITSDIWGPGLWSEVKVEISGAPGTGPCRFVQKFPEGFFVQPANSPGCDMFFSDNTLNIVWTRLPAVKSFTVSYEVMPEKSISGAIELGGTFYYVGRDPEKRSSVSLPVKNILVDASGSGKPARNTEAEQLAPQPVGQPVVQTSPKNQEPAVVFRIQVLTSSSKLTDNELKRRLGVSFQEPVTVVQKGTIFKYLVGSFSSVESAGVLLNRLKGDGVTEAFMVAFLNGEQITIDQAISK